tara:strand:+ start:9337 stop:10707 length:1371 start_codon:yes stop_codon:yes gene_type:complete
MAAKDLYSGSSTGVLFTDRRNFYIDPQVVKELWTDVTPFTTVIANRETRNVPDPVFKMFEHKQPWIKQSFTSASNPAAPGANTESADFDIAAGYVGLPAPDASWLGLVVECWDSTETTNRGVAVVTTVTDSNTIQVTPINADMDIASGDIFHVVGNAHGEGGYSPEAWADELKVVYNSCQIFKNPLEITGTLLEAALRGESSELARLRMQKSQEHKIQKERAFLFGKRVGGTGLQESAYADGYNDTNADETFADGGIDGPAVGTIASPAGSGSGKIRMTYGMVSAIENYGESTTTHDNQNIFTASEASYTYSNFVDDMEKVFQYVPTSGVKKAFVGAGALGYWSKMAGNSGFAGNNGWSVNLGDMKRDALGFNYRVLETPHGMLQMIPTPALRGPYNKYMLVVDDDNLFHSQYRAPMYQTNIKTDNAYDGVKDQYFSDEGIGITNINSHALIKITA